MKKDPQELKNSIDLVEFIKSKGIDLKKQGKNFVGLCPFHDDKKPSFTVNLEENLWQCFGCNKGGDIFSFLQEIEGLTFQEALQQLKKCHENKREDTNPSISLIVLLIFTTKHFMRIQEA